MTNDLMLSARARSTGLQSAIPATHPHKQAIETRLLHLIRLLGHPWFIAVEPSDHGHWSLSLGRRHRGAIGRVWNTTLTSAEQGPLALEIWLRALAGRIQDEMQLHVGWKPGAALGSGVRERLLRLVETHRGGVTRDGYIVLPRRGSGPFLADAETLGVPLEVGLWERVRPIYAPNVVRGRLRR
jgi:hypothetical protein